MSKPVVVMEDWVLHSSSVDGKWRVRFDWWRDLTLTFDPTTTPPGCYSTEHCYVINGGGLIECDHVSISNRGKFGLGQRYVDHTDDYDEDGKLIVIDESSVQYKYTQGYTAHNELRHKYRRIIV